MSTTLTNGLKLPDKGSVDWYADMQNNYTILDGAVGTVAEHTTALAGKAPLVHTHGKSDITDLFNSANTWSAEQTVLNNFYVVKENNYELGQSYSNGNHLSGLHIKDKNGAAVGLLDIVDRSYGNTEMRIRVQQKFDPNSNNRSTSGDILFNEVLVGITPTKTNYVGFSADLWGGNTYNLGTASSQWNNLYAKNYYYDGTAWGLDKENTWSQINDFKTLRLYGAASNNLVMYPPSGEKGDSSTFGFNIICKDKNAGGYNASGVANIGMGQSGGTSYVALNASTKGSTDNNIHSIQVGLQIAASDNANTGSFYPTQNGGINLGTSTNKWKSLNGINPGALSLPNLTMETYDPTSGWYNLDTTGWNLTGSPIDISSSVLKDGYVYVCLACDSTGYVVICEGVFSYPNCYYSTSGLPISGYARALLPVRRGTDVRLYLKGTSVYSARLFPALGNV